MAKPLIKSLLHNNGRGGETICYKTTLPLSFSSNLPIIEQMPLKYS